MQKLEKQIIDFDNRWVDPSLPTISISTVLSMIQEPFDSKSVAEKTYNKRFNDPQSEYYQMTVEQIMESWQAKGAASLHYGSLLDDYIGISLTGNADDLELYKLDNDYDGDERLRAITMSYDNFIKLMETKPSIKFVDRERTLFYEMDGFYVKGRFDALFFDEDTNTFIIVDWKSTDKIETQPNQWTKRLLGAAKEFNALNGVTYTMQTHFYKTALLNHYLPDGYNVEVRIVNLPGHAFSDGKDFNVLKEQIPYNKEKLDAIFSFGFKKNNLLSKKNGNL